MTMFDLGGDHIVEVGGHATDTFDTACTVPIEHSELTAQAYAERVRGIFDSAAERLGSRAVNYALSDSDN